MNMIERVARALLAHRLGVPVSDSQWFNDRWKSRDPKILCAEARAAVEAMRKPTKTMLNAGFEEQDYDDRLEDSADDFNRQNCGRVYAAMIDAILKETENGTP